MQRSSHCLVGLASATAFFVLPAWALAQDAKDIVASQLRAQGYACANPQSATRDNKASKPNETVWIVVCDNASYRATLIPNMAARVEALTKTDTE